MKWAGYVARERKGEYTYMNLSERDHMEGLRADGRIILTWIFKISGGGHGLD